jgi:photosystem II stability/assembly factor-like uncharacterized protein
MKHVIRIFLLMFPLIAAAQWEKVEHELLEHANTWDFVVDGNKTTFITNTGIYRKNAGDDNWVSLTAGTDLPVSLKDFGSIVKAGDAYVIYNRMPAKVLWSDDDGNTWQSNDLPVLSFGNLISHQNALYFFYSDQSSSETYVYRSTNYGASWEEIMGPKAVSSASGSPIRIAENGSTSASTKSPYTSC